MVRSNTTRYNRWAVSRNILHPSFRYLETELSSLDGSDISSGASSDDDQVQLLCCSGSYYKKKMISIEFVDLSFEQFCNNISHGDRHPSRHTPTKATGWTRSFLIIVVCCLCCFFCVDSSSFLVTGSLQVHYLPVAVE